MVGEVLIVEILFLFINLILLVKRLPLLGIPVPIFTVYIGAIYFLPDTTLSFNKIFVAFILLIATLALIANAMDMVDKRRKK